MNMSHQMAKIGVVLGLTALVTLTSGFASPAQSEPKTDEAVQSPLQEHRDAKHAGSREDEVLGVEKEVKAFIIHYIATLEGGDENAIRRLFVDDDRFAWYTDGEKSYSTIDDVLAGMRKYAGIRFETNVSEICVLPLSTSLASARSRFQTKLTIPGAEDHEYGGVITWLVEKASSSGEWRVLLGHTSTPGGPPKETTEEGKR